MVDAVSLSGNSYRAVSRVLETRALAPSAESRPAESALAALSLPQPVTRVTAPSDTAEEAGDLGFLYTPAGLPAASALPAYAVPAADAAAARSRSGTARLAVDSSELNTLLSSFLTARAPSANPAPSPNVPAETSSADLAQTARQSIITQLYSQF